MTKPDAYPASEANGMRQRVGGMVRPPSFSQLPQSTTQTKAKAFEPGAIRVRFSALKDILFVLRLRYMATIFHLSSFALGVQVLMWMYSKPDLVQHIPKETVSDACSRLYAELQGLWPLAALVACSFFLRRDRSVYLLDFTLFDPPDEWRTSREGILQMLRNLGKVHSSFGEAELEFMSKVLNNSGTGEATAWPPGIVRCRDSDVPQDQSMQAARMEAETVICTCLKDLFQTTGVQPKEVDFLIINCSLFSPTPSLCAMACNRFQMRSNVKTYNLSGMGWCVRP